MNNDILRRLAEPFAPTDVTFKPGASKDNKCMALAYADFRAYMDRLDAVCGTDWSVEYQPWGDHRIIARLTIACPDKGGSITRSSTGEADAQDEKNNLAGSVTEAMAFKRAAAMWGLGRYLYSLPNIWVEFDAQRKRITDQGQRELERRYREWYDKEMAALCPWTAWEGPQAAYAWAVAAGYATCTDHAANALRQVVAMDFNGAIKKSNWPHVAEAFYHNRLTRQDEKVAAA